jgi:hypothetical protein
MLAYNDMYNISWGILTCSKITSNKRLLSINHSKLKRDKLEPLFPVSKYTEWTRENFIIAVLYLCFNKAPSSIHVLLAQLRELDSKEVFAFKNEIINYRTFLIQDIEKLKVDSEHISTEYMISLYRIGKIKWYTFYFYITLSGYDINKILESRVNGYLIKRIKFLLLYITFSERSTLLVKELLTDLIEI